MKLFRLFFLVLLSSTASSLDCPGTGEFLDADSLMHFENCTHVTGNVIIKHSTFVGDIPRGMLPVTAKQLSLLSSIQEIDGYLLIENAAHVNFTNLRFLRNLQIVHGFQTLELLSRQYSLVITQNNFLQTLSLASLRSIRNGGVQIANNPELCLVDTIAIEDYLRDSNVRRIGGLSQDCTNVMCHEHCLMNRGCWGVLADECVECRHYSYLGTCVESCNMSVSYVDEDLQRCIPYQTVPSTTQHSPTTYASTTLATTTVHTNMNNNDDSPTHHSTTDDEITNTSVLIPTIHETTHTINKDRESSVVITITTSSVVVGILSLVLCIILLSSFLCYHSKKSKKRKLPSKTDWQMRKTEKSELGENETRAVNNGHESLERRQHISIGSLARTPAFFSTPITSTGDHEQHFSSSHDNHMTPTDAEIHVQAPNVRYERPPINSTTLTTTPPMHRDTSIHTITHSTTPTSNKTPSPNLIHSLNQRTQQQQQSPLPMTMGAGGVYSTGTHHHSHRGTLSSSRGTSSRMSHSSSQRHSRTSSSMRVTPSTRTSVNSLNGLLE